MITFITKSELQKRLRIAPQTLEKRLAQRGIQPDAALVNGTQTSLIFNSERLPELRKAICQPGVIL